MAATVSLPITFCVRDGWRRAAASRRPVQRLGGKIDARRDHAALVVAVLARRCRRWWPCRNRPRSARPCSAACAATALTSRSAPTASGRSALDLHAEIDSRIAHDQGLAFEIAAAKLAQIEQRGRHHGRDDGGVEIGEAEPFQRQKRFSSTAYSSAVRAVSVTARHSARIVLPSWTAKTMLVLPASMASSMA